MLFGELVSKELCNEQTTNKHSGKDVGFFSDIVPVKPGVHLNIIFRHSTWL